MTKGLHRYYGNHDLHSITSSCHDRQPQLGTPERRDLFLHILEDARQKYRFVVHAYVIMPEHFHLLITEPELGDPSVVMKVVKERFTRKLRTQDKTEDKSKNKTEGAPTHRALCDEWDPPPRIRPSVAKALLRFQRADRTKTNREAVLHTPQPCKAGTGGKTGAVGLEQLSLLSLPRDRTSASEISGVADGDQGPSSHNVWQGHKRPPYSQQPTHSQRTRMSGAPRFIMENNASYSFLRRPGTRIFLSNFAGISSQPAITRVRYNPLRD
jgi:REP element-mobilizing transposase RayT